MKTIVIFGGCGLVGSYLCELLNSSNKIIVIDKNLPRFDLDSLGIQFIKSDILDCQNYEFCLNPGDIYISCQAQIKSNYSADFYKNNVESQKIINALAIKFNAKLIHISSSVVNSLADDDYVHSKTEQERQVTCQNNFKYTILRPTLMYGHYDNKHFGWLANFLSRSPVFPVPGNGKFQRQPLYAKDFCRIIQAIIERDLFNNSIFDISGLEKKSYIEIILMIKQLINSRSIILYLPISLFRGLLKIYSSINTNPPFTVKQLDALIIPEIFPGDDWSSKFEIKPTSLSEGLKETFSHEKL